MATLNSLIKAQGNEEKVFSVIKQSEDKKIEELQLIM
jgi:hypothetical protein